jgi:hypothetical protein
MTDHPVYSVIVLYDTVLVIMHDVLEIVEKNYTRFRIRTRRVRMIVGETIGQPYVLWLVVNRRLLSPSFSVVAR